MPDLETLIAFDVGTKRIGVAVGRAISRSANPLDIVAAEPEEARWQAIGMLVKQWRPDAWIVGMPLDYQGRGMSGSAAMAETFAKKLLERYPLPLIWIDEILTTKEARARVVEQRGAKALKKMSVDSIAAQLLLEAYWQTQCYPLPPE